ncbi:hypothetical protein JCM19237_2669 [Photobacterium aphoticum]|uniref:Uncharacterized protein n=1 Tax=Photobacterium aphoticum TaxID=754436 RepID=A0A090RG99_9GAMM|nr:hypothetical protein JCM19237_2669 [Photobacterium aphoticum]
MRLFTLPAQRAAELAYFQAIKKQLVRKGFIALVEVWAGGRLRVRRKQ